MVGYRLLQGKGSRKVFGESIGWRDGGPRGKIAVVSPRWVVLLSILIIFAVLGLVRLFDLQILRGSYFRGLADGNRIRRIPVKAARGEILDRNGKSLARNVPVYKIATFSSGGVVLQTQKISREEALGIQSSDPELAARIVVDIEREYPLGEAGAHLVGYVNEASSEEVGRSYESCKDGQPFQLGDVVGRMGVEAQNDCILRGVNGEDLVEVDTGGRLVRKLGRREPVAGKSIKLTIGADLQQEAYVALVGAPVLARGLENKPGWEGGELARGAIVAQEAFSGEVLALVSAPSFDPNRISREYGGLVRDPNLPLFNRAIGGAYHPGSTFKIVTAAAGLEDGKIDRDFVYVDTGVVTVNDYQYKNWYFTQYGRTEGELGVVRAIARSTDTFFYEVGGMVGVDVLVSFARKFGLGRLTGIDLPGEVAGLVPTAGWKQKVKGERWFLGNTYHMSIGQGDIAASPLQVNQMTLVIANGGLLCAPRVVKDGDSQSRVLDGTWQNSECAEVGLEGETVKIITEGMIGACSTGGTAFPLFGFGSQVACKTGTAQFSDSLASPGRGRTHAWLTAFAPAERPEVVVTVLIEEGGEGSRVAAPVVRKILEKWFGG